MGIGLRVQDRKCTEYTVADDFHLIGASQIEILIKPLCTTPISTELADTLGIVA
jgi:hypothetical protein